MARSRIESQSRHRQQLMQERVELNTLVRYQGRVAVVVARAKPVRQDWKYDLLIQQGVRPEIVVGVTADELSTANPKAA